jgi:hypothetical protein
MLVSLKKIGNEGRVLQDQPILVERCNLHSSTRFGIDAPEDATIPLLIGLGKDIRAARSGKWEVEQPALRIVTVPIYEVLDGREVVHIK